MEKKNVFYVDFVSNVVNKAHTQANTHTHTHSNAKTILKLSKNVYHSFKLNIFNVLAY